MAPRTGAYLRARALRELIGAGAVDATIDGMVIRGLPLDGALMVTPSLDKHVVGWYAARREQHDFRWMGLVQERYATSPLPHYWAGLPFKDLAFLLGEIAEDRRKERTRGAVHD